MGIIGILTSCGDSVVDKAPNTGFKSPYGDYWNFNRGLGMVAIFWIVIRLSPLMGIIGILTQQDCRGCEYAEKCLSPLMGIIGILTKNRSNKLSGTSMFKSPYGDYWNFNLLPPPPTSVAMVCLSPLMGIIGILTQK